MHLNLNFPFKLWPKFGLRIIRECILQSNFYGIRYCINCRSKGKPVCISKRINAKLCILLSFQSVFRMNITLAHGSLLAGMLELISFVLI